MNPFDYWYNTNNDLEKFMDEYFLEYSEQVEDDVLKMDIIKLYNNGNTIEKTQVLTFLAIIKNYFVSTGGLEKNES